MQMMTPQVKPAYRKSELTHICNSCGACLSPCPTGAIDNWRQAESASSDVCHIILDFGGMSFPVLEGQSIGIMPPGVDASGRAHHLRLYSVASPRDGEKPNHNNLSLTVKRVTENHEGGVAAAFEEVCATQGLSWESLHPEFLRKGRFHVETY